MQKTQRWSPGQAARLAGTPGARRAVGRGDVGIAPGSPEIVHGWVRLHQYRALPGGRSAADAQHCGTKRKRRVGASRLLKAQAPMLIAAGATSSCKSMHESVQFLAEWLACIDGEKAAVATLVSVASCADSSSELRPPSSQPLPAGCFPRRPDPFHASFNGPGELSLVRDATVTGTWLQAGRWPPAPLVDGNRSRGTTPSGRQV